MSQKDSREILIQTASALFRKKGYSGVGLNEILKTAGLPKGSLYYHFPDGKRELADAATRWAGEWVERILTRTFEGASSFEAGSLAACEAISEAIATSDHVLACPVLSVLQAVSIEPALRKTAEEVYGRWTGCLTRQAERFGVHEPSRAAFSLHIRLQGAWVIAYAQQSNAPFLMLAEELRLALPE